MNKLEQRKQELLKELGEIELELTKPKKWSPEGGDWVMYGDGDIQEGGFTCENYSRFGMEFKTKEDAERCRNELHKWLMKYLFILVGVSVLTMTTYWLSGGDFERGRELGIAVGNTFLLWLFASVFVWLVGYDDK